MGPSFQEKVVQPLQDNDNVQVLILDTYNGTPAQAESYRQITGITAPMLREASRGLNYAGARLEDIVVVDQDLIVRFFTNATTEHLMPAVVQMANSLVNKTPVIRLSLRELYFGRTMQAGQTKTVVLQIENTGAGPLDITGYRTTVPGLTMEPATLTVGANEKPSVNLIFSPTQTGTLSGTLTLTHNNQAVSALQLTIRPLTIESAVPPVIPADPCADFDGNGQVDFSDFLSLVRVFGTVNTTFDLNTSGLVDFADFLILVRSFGKSLN